jgi:hypothetical protein
MRREAVAQGMRVRRTWATTIENAADVAGRQPHSALVAEQRGARVGRHHLATDSQPGDQRLDRRSAERHPPFLATLAPDRDRLRRHIHGVDVERAQLATRTPLP